VGFFAFLSLQAADLNGDGHEDLIGVAQIKDWSAGTGNGSFGPAQVLAPSDLSSTVFSTGHAADLDADGDLDFLAATLWGIEWHENVDGLGGFVPYVIAPEFYTDYVLAADLDGDGDQDVLFGSSALDYVNELGKVAWIENLGAGSFALERALSPGSLTLYFPDLAVGDLDGDGDIDVVTAAPMSGPDKVLWFENGSNDCNGNALPDSCEPDLDADGLIDACE
jgi:hypothetical protein